MSPASAMGLFSPGRRLVMKWRMKISGPGIGDGLRGVLVEVMGFLLRNPGGVRKSAAFRIGGRGFQMAPDDVAYRSRPWLPWWTAMAAGQADGAALFLAEGAGLAPAAFHILGSTLQNVPSARFSMRKPLDGACSPRAKDSFLALSAAASGARFPALVVDGLAFMARRWLAGIAMVCIGAGGHHGAPNSHLRQGDPTSHSQFTVTFNRAKSLELVARLRGILTSTRSTPAPKPLSVSLICTPPTPFTASVQPVSADPYSTLGA